MIIIVYSYFLLVELFYSHFNAGVNSQREIHKNKNKKRINQLRKIYKIVKRTMLCDKSKITYNVVS